TLLAAGVGEEQPVIAKRQTLVGNLPRRHQQTDQHQRQRHAERDRQERRLPTMEEHLLEAGCPAVGFHQSRSPLAAPLRQNRRTGTIAVLPYHPGKIAPSCCRHSPPRNRGPSPTPWRPVSSGRPPSSVAPTRCGSIMTTSVPRAARILRKTPIIMSRS